MIKVNAIIRYGNKILVVKRSKKDGGFWQTVTGTVEGGETLIETVKREVKEEAGLDVVVNENPFYFFIWEDGKTVEAVFECFTQKDNVVLSDEHTEYMWLQKYQSIRKVDKKENKNALNLIN